MKEFIMFNTVSETALINSNVVSNLYSQPDDVRLLPKRSPDKSQRLVMMNDERIYHVKYSGRNSFVKRKQFES